MLVAVAMVVTVACNCPSSLIKGAAQMEKKCSVNSSLSYTCVVQDSEIERAK